MKMFDEKKVMGIVAELEGDREGWNKIDTINKNEELVKQYSIGCIEFLESCVMMAAKDINEEGFETKFDEFVEMVKIFSNTTSDYMMAMLDVMMINKINAEEFIDSYKKIEESRKALN